MRGSVDEYIIVFERLIIAQAAGAINQRMNKDLIHFAIDNYNMGKKIIRSRMKFPFFLFQRRFID